MTSEKQALWGRIGGLTAWSLHPAATMIGPAHRGFLARFERLVLAAATANGEVLTPQQLAERADRARRAYMISLAARSAAVRRRGSHVEDAA